MDWFSDRSCMSLADVCTESLPRSCVYISTEMNLYSYQFFVGIVTINTDNSFYSANPSIAYR